MPNERPRRPKKSNPAKPVLILFLILLILIAAGAGIYFFPLTEKPSGSVETGARPETSMDAPGQEIEPEITAQPAADQKPSAEDMQTGAEQEHIDEPGLTGPIVPGQENDQEEECILLAGRLSEFFHHVDSQDYMKPFDLDEPAQAYFTKLAYKLLDNPPVVTRESDDLYTILKNMAHFFRVIGKTNILLIKTILDRERDKIEDVASQLYQWTSLGNCPNDRFQFSAPLDKVYEYAGFFLNTMGGRSYLFRRDSRSRLLVNYYSILIVENTNKQGINRHGIDISPLIPQLINEIESSNQLIYKENYLDQLYTLLEKYQ